MKKIIGKCPKCGSVIYSRWIAVCGRCGGKLPSSLMFDSATRNKIEELIDQDRKRVDWERKFPGHDTSGGV